MRLESGVGCDWNNDDGEDEDEGESSAEEGVAYHTCMMLVRIVETRAPANTTNDTSHFATRDFLPTGDGVFNLAESGILEIYLDVSVGIHDFFSGKGVS